jgi:hypothetical protein
MNEINVVIVVDTEGALSSGSLEANVYMVDTNKYIGSWQQGQSDLHTVCQDGQTVKWWAEALNSGESLDIKEFGGQIVSTKICIPKEDPYSGNGAWDGQVETKGSIGSYIYSVTLDLDSKSMTFNAHLKVV